MSSSNKKKSKKVCVLLQSPNKKYHKVAMRQSSAAKKLEFRKFDPSTGKHQVLKEVKLVYKAK